MMKPLINVLMGKPSRLILLVILPTIVLLWLPIIYSMRGTLSGRHAAERAARAKIAVGRACRSIHDLDGARSALETWSLITSTNYAPEGYPLNPRFVPLVQAAEAEGVSNIIRGLEDYSHKSFGSNLAAWRAWLDEHAGSPPHSP